MSELSGDALAAMLPFAVTCGIEIDSAERERVTGQMAWREDLCTSGGILHGGSLMTLADSLGAVCAFLNLPKGAGTATVESKTNLIRPVSAGHVHGESTPVNVGRTMIVVQTRLHDDAGKLVALTIQTQAVILAS